VKKILILAANPAQTEHLSLDEEVREIKEALQLSKYREQFIIESNWAVRPDDIRRSILNFQPNIIHFSGHGAGTKGLCFQDDNKNIQFVAGETLAQLFGQFAGKIECVLLNACYSEVQANAIVEEIDYVIGMNAPIGDKAAIKFAVGFYDGLGGYDPQYSKGTSIEFAFNLGCNAIGLAGLSGNNTREVVRVSGISAEKSIAVLKKKPGLVDKITIVEPVKPTIIRYSGQVKNYICQNLVDDWEELADQVGIPKHHKSRFEKGKEPNRVWEWLEQRSRLSELEVALTDIGRDDLVEELKKN
jgi:hypothetical protein